MSETTFKPLLRRYGGAALAVAVALAARSLLHGLLGERAPYITFFPAIVAASWLGGFGPGVLATGLSIAAAHSFEKNPDGWWSGDGSQALRAALFGAICIFVSFWNAKCQAALWSAKTRLAELEQARERQTQTEAELAAVRDDAERTRDLLQTVLTSIGDGVITTDLDGNVSFLNREAEQLTGWTREEALGKPVEEIFPIEHGETRLRVVSTTVAGEVTQIANQTVLVRRRGGEIAIEGSTAPIRDEEGRVLGGVQVFRDVSARTREQRARERSEERLKVAIGVGRIGIWEWHPEDDRIEWSAEMSDVFGVGMSQAPARMEELERLVHHEDRESLARAVGAVIADGERFGHSFRATAENGETRWVSIVAVVYRNTLGDPVRLLGSAIDQTALKAAESRLREQWATFDTALSNTFDPIYLFDPEGRFTYANQALLRLWGMALDDVTGKGFHELRYPKELADRLAREVREVVESRTSFKAQAAFTGASGEERQYEYIFVPVLGDDGRVRAVAGSTRDVTERSEMEEKLRKSEERLSLALEAAGGVGVWDWDVKGDVVYCDARLAELFGLDARQTFEGAPIAAFTGRVVDDDRARVEQSIVRSKEEGVEYADEYRVLGGDGQVRWIYTRGRCQFDAQGEPTRFPGVAFDISRRKEAELGQAELAGKLRAIFDGTYSHIWLLTLEGSLIEANQASLAFRGITDVLWQRFWSTPWFQSCPRTAEQVKQAVEDAGSGDAARFIAPILRVTGEIAYFDFSFFPIRNDEGRVVLIVAEGHDVTDLRRGEELQVRSNAELQRVNRELEEFAYVASHDLQEPLRMVNIYTQLILEERGDHAHGASEYAGFVKQGVRKMEALIHDLLNFSRAVHSEREPEGTADLAISVNEALTMLHQRIEETGSTIVVGPMPKTTGDTWQMAHVFQNFISNAIKYRKSGEAAAVRISAERRGEEWILTVSDAGIGFEQKYADKVWGLFKRLHNSDEYPGTGLGLAICKRIVERFGGRVWAEGRPGEGARFFFALPASER